MCYKSHEVQQQQKEKRERAHRPRSRSRTRRAAGSGGAPRTSRTRVASATRAPREELEKRDRGALLTPCASARAARALCARAGDQVARRLARFNEAMQLDYLLVTRASHLNLSNT